MMGFINQVKRRQWKRKEESENYLDFIPEHRQTISWDADADGKITIYIENKGVFHWLAQKLLNKPRISQIHLDEMGNFVWCLIDGERSIYDIAVLVKEQFGERAEPLYERLVTYLRNLENYEFVRMKKS